MSDYSINAYRRCTRIVYISQVYIKFAISSIVHQPFVFNDLLAYVKNDFALILALQNQRSPVHWFPHHFGMKVSVKLLFCIFKFWNHSSECKRGCCEKSQFHTWKYYRKKFSSLDNDLEGTWYLDYEFTACTEKPFILMNSVFMNLTRPKLSFNHDFALFAIYG